MILMSDDGTYDIDNIDKEYDTLCTIWKAILSLIHPLADPVIADDEHEMIMPSLLSLMIITESINILKRKIRGAFL